MADCSFNTLPHRDTHSFSKLVTDYLDRNSLLTPFYRFTPDDEGLAKAIDSRKNFSTDRNRLVEALEIQYQGFPVTDAVRENIALLKDRNTYTVCTAHQPNLMTGHLYFFYKILQTVVLAAHLKQSHPEHHFVPVYYMGSEDNDLEELGTFNYLQKDFRWQTKQTGAVGRMYTNDLQPLLNELYPSIRQSGPYAETLKQIIQNAYERQPTIGRATRSIVNELFGSLGVLVLDPDDALLKESFVDIIKKETEAPVAYSLVSETSEHLSKHYRAQAYVRPVNFFYLKGNIRERIESSVNGTWRVLNTDIRWESKEAIHREIEAHPERFSPNVILRGLFQETVLPNVAFIGGGSEVAYWMQLKSLFDHYGVFYPPLILRQSIMIEEKSMAALQMKLNLDDNTLFGSTDGIIKNYVKEHSVKQLDFTEEQLQLSQLLHKIKAKAMDIDPTLGGSSEAVLTKIRHQIAVLEKKMIKAEKKNMSTEVNQIYKLKAQLFPNGGLQERHDNFIPYFLKWGHGFAQLLLQHIRAYGDQFVIIKECTGALGTAHSDTVSSEFFSRF